MGRRIAAVMLSAGTLGALGWGVPAAAQASTPKATPHATVPPVCLRIPRGNELQIQLGYSP